MTYTSKERVCLNADKSAVVDCESDQAAYLLVGAGGTLTDEQARKYGLVGKDKADEPEAEEKAQAPAENKARKAAPEDKGR